jgi:DNA modification methylase
METLSNTSNPLKQETILDKATLFHGNNMEALSKLADNSIDSVVTDPPYGLSFMGNKWDYDVPSVEFWKEVLRVLKPGGHVLSFGGTRTYHRMVINIEDAGFEIRDQIMWIYGQGFPKSRNIGKDIKKHDPTNEEFDALGTNLKPANEPIVLARKPISKKTIANNVKEFGTGGINIDKCRIKRSTLPIQNEVKKGHQKLFGINSITPNHEIATTEGRFPSNVIFDNQMASILDLQSGILKGGKNMAPYKKPIHNNVRMNSSQEINRKGYEDIGGPSKFFYVVKPSTKERELGLNQFDGQKINGRDSGQDNRDVPFKKRTSIRKNTHPTVKPVDLMRYLVKLVTPKGGTIIDPFMGSGSTGIASLLEGFNFIGMEMEDSFFKISKQRISSFEEFEALKQDKKSKKKKVKNEPTRVFGFWGNQGLCKAS